MYKTVKTRKTELLAVLKYKAEKKEFDSDYYSKMVELMRLHETNDLFEICDYILKKFKKES